MPRIQENTSDGNVSGTLGMAAATAGLFGSIILIMIGFAGMIGVGCGGTYCC